MDYFTSPGETATIVAVWTRDEIALAADSGAEQLLVDQSPATICKVQKTGKVAYTMAGLYRDPVDSLDTFALVSASRRRSPHKSARAT